MSTRPALFSILLAMTAVCGAAATGHPAARWSRAPSTPTGAAPSEEIIIYAAASLQDALREVGSLCEGQAGARLIFNFGPSNDLERQIVAANKADLFFSADEKWMDEVAKAGLLDSASRRDLLSNHLVVVVPTDSELNLGSAADLAGQAVQRLSLANPDAVPAGRYAKAWLEGVGVWDKVKDRVAPGPDVRAALAVVESGVVQAGIVYRTDAALSHRVRVAFAPPKAEEPRIVYPVAALRDRPHLEVTHHVIDCFAGQQARMVFERFGFGVLESAPQRAGTPNSSHR